MTTIPQSKPFSQPSYELQTRSGTRLQLKAGINANDANALAAIFASMPPWSTYPYPPARLAHYFHETEPNAPRFRVLDDQGICGAVGLRRAWLCGPYLQFLGFYAQHQGCGYGDAIIEWIANTARAADLKNVWVLSSNNNSGARRFYERKGFVYVADLDDLVQPGRTEILMRLRIDAARN